MPAAAQIDRHYLERVASLHLWPLYEAALKMQRDKMLGAINNAEKRDALVLMEANRFIAYYGPTHRTEIIPTFSEFCRRVASQESDTTYMALCRDANGILTRRVIATPRLLTIYKSIYGDKQHDGTRVRSDLGGCDEQPHREGH